MSFRTLIRDDPSHKEGNSDCVADGHNQDIRKTRGEVPQEREKANYPDRALAEITNSTSWRNLGRGYFTHGVTIVGSAVVCNYARAIVAKNLFIVGVQKAGTTVLHSYLSRHPDISMSARKELHFFDNDYHNWSDPDYAALEGHFDGVPVMVRGEATPIYLYWPNCLERLQVYDATSKIIVMLRHPTYRAFSHWKMEMVRNAEMMSFAEAISDQGRSRVRDAPSGVHRVFSYVERGFYAPQIIRLLSLFPREQIHFATTDDLWLNPERFLARIQDFLDVPRRLAPTREYIVLADTKMPDELDVASRRELDMLFADDIRETIQLTGLDLFDWLSPEYTEPEKYNMSLSFICGQS